MESVASLSVKGDSSTLFILNEKKPGAYCDRAFSVLEQRFLSWFSLVDGGGWFCFQPVTFFLDAPQGNLFLLGELPFGRFATVLATEDD